MFWDLYGEQGHPIRTTISEMGPLLLARLMGLNETQEGVLNIAFRYADDQRPAAARSRRSAVDADRLRRERRRTGHANTAMSPRPASARSSASCSRSKARARPISLASRRFEINDFIRCDENGKGVINVLAADKLMQSPKLYATFLLWLLSELFEALPEVGDPDKPKLVFFFDEAHLLFEDAPEALFDKVEQVVRLIRSKGVGVYFITQNPIDIPEKIAGQLGNRVQHALRAFTPRDQRAIKAAAETFRINPDLDVETAITELKVGEALVSTLDDDGAPTMVQRTLIAPPRSRLGPVTPKERAIIQSISPFDGKYETAVDRESAAEVLAPRPPMRRQRRRWWRSRARRCSAPSRASHPACGRRPARPRWARRPPRPGRWSRARCPAAGPVRLADGIGCQRRRRIDRHCIRRRDAGPVCARTAGRIAALMPHAASFVEPAASSSGWLLRVRQCRGGAIDRLPRELMRPFARRVVADTGACRARCRDRRSIRRKTG